MTSDAWKELGYAIRQARLGLGWSLEELAHEALGNGARKGYVSQVEKGRRNLSPETIDKFDQALSLPPEVVKDAHIAPPPEKPEAEDEIADREAERLMSRAARDAEAPQVAEALMIALAYEFAGGKYVDLQTAYTGLRAALEAAERIRQRGEMPPDNTGSQLNRVLAEVAKLNSEGSLDAADNLLEQEERRMREAHKAEQERMAEQARMLLEKRLDQDRLRNDPDAAAKRLIADLHRQAPPGGVVRATHNLVTDWRKLGARAGDPFALRVALALAKVNYDKAKGPLKPMALVGLGNCHIALGERAASNRHLRIAIKAFRGVLKRTSKRKDPVNWSNEQNSLGIALHYLGLREHNGVKLRESIAAHEQALTVRTRETTSKDWAISQNNLGNALRGLGELEEDSSLMRAAITAQEQALTVRTKEATAEHWAESQSNLGLALRWLGAFTGDAALFDRASAAYALCLTAETKDADPFNWAKTQWNLGDLALARFALEPDPALLDEAEAHVRDARAVFVEGSDHQTEQCDGLLEKITKERAGL